MPDAIELLSTRSSFKAVALTAPGPSATEIDKLLTIACRGSRLRIFVFGRVMAAPAGAAITFEPKIAKA